jgi:hypothetical protein
VTLKTCPIRSGHVGHVVTLGVHLRKQPDIPLFIFFISTQHTVAALNLVETELIVKPGSRGLV